MIKNGATPGASIRTLRSLAGLTLAEVADDASTTTGYLSQVETGKTQATPVYIGRVTAVIADRMVRKVPA